MNNEIRYIGADCGTGYFTFVENDEIKFQRNAFLEIDPLTTTKAHLKSMDVSYSQINNKLYVIGSKAVGLANIFNSKELKRPMQEGTLNPLEQNSLPIIRELIKGLIGMGKAGDIVSYCTPAKPIDKIQEIDYHEDALGQIFQSLGYKTKTINEAVALGYVGLADNKLTGITMSLGSGMCNIAISYHGICALKFSVCHAGDWLDEQVSRDTGITKSKAQKIKEAGNYSISKDDAHERTSAQNAIKTYYESLIRYILANIQELFTKTTMPEFPEAVPIIIGGGSSLVPGFIEVFKEQFVQKEFPLEISEIKLVDEPLTAVARGCLIHAKLEDN